MLGENAIRFLGLDRAPLEAIAERIGPEVADIIGRASPSTPSSSRSSTAAAATWARPRAPPGSRRSQPMLDEDLAAFDAFV